MTQHNFLFPQALPRGTKVNAYLLEEPVGQGGFGITYRAVDLEHSQEVAVKEFFPRDLVVRRADLSVHARDDTDEDTLRWGVDSFLQEAKLLSRCDHPNIVRFGDRFEALGTGFFVMDYVHGSPLSVVLRDYPEGVGSATLIAFALPLVDAVEHMHGLGIAHRDIKPQNILVTEEGRPVFVDFGSARELKAGMAHGFTAIASSYYSPPEQYRRSRRQGFVSDIYSFAATLYHARLGRPPQEAMSRGEEDKIKPLLPDAEEEADRRLFAAIDAGLALDPGDRPASAAAFRDLLLGREAAQTAGTSRDAGAPVADEPQATKREEIRGGAERTSPGLDLPPPVPPRRRESVQRRALERSLLAAAVVGVIVLVVLGRGLAGDPAELVGLLEPSGAGREDGAVHVALDGSGEFSSVIEALAGRNGAGRIRVGRGTYEAPGRVTGSVVIEGTGLSPGEVVIRNRSGETCLLVDAGELALENLSLVSEAGGSCIKLTGGEARLSNLRIAARQGAGVEVAGGSLVMDGVAIERARTFGMTVRGPGQAVVRGSRFGPIDGTGVRVLQGGTLELRDSRIAAAQNVGLLLAGSSSATLTNARIDGAGESAVRVIGSTLEMIGSTVTAPGRDGVNAGRGSDVRLLGNRIEDPGRSGIVADATDALDIADNTITGCGAPCIVVEDVSGGSVRGNELDGPDGEAAIALRRSRGLEVADNRIRGSRVGPISLTDSQDNRIEGNISE